MKESKEKMVWNLRFLAVLIAVMAVLSTCSVKKAQAAEADFGKLSMEMAEVSAKAKQEYLEEQAVVKGEEKSESEEKEPTISGIIAIDSSSMYVDKLSGEKLYKGFVVQTSAMVVFEKIGAYINVTGTKVADGKRFSKSSKNSVDYSVGIEKEIGLIKVDAGYGFSDIKNSKGDIHFLYVVIEAPDVIKGLTPYVMAEVDIPVKKRVLEGGFLYRAGAKYALKVSKQEIVFDLSAAGHDGAYGYRPQAVSSGRLTISTILEAWGLEVKPEINFQKNFGRSVKNGGIAEDIIWIGLRIALPIKFL